MFGGLGVAGACIAQTAAVPAPATPPPPAAAALAESRPGAMAQVIGRTERLLIVLPAAGDTAAGLAERFLGRADRAWWLGDADKPIAAGQPLVVPLQHPNPTGFARGQVQTLPILAYHRFGPAASPMQVTPAQFEAQLALLLAEGWHVLPLASLPAFLAGREPLPPRSLAITVDGGHESFYRLAFPLIQKHRLVVTLFIQTDLVGSRDFMNWEQLQEVAGSGLVSVQAHSKTQQNLAVQGRGESALAYRRRLEVEVQTSRRIIEQRLAGSTVNQLAYPSGRTSPSLVDTLERNSFDLGLTAQRGSNAFFQPPWLLRRALVLGDFDLAEFRRLLETSQNLESEAETESARSEARPERAP